MWKTWGPSSLTSLIRLTFQRLPGFLLQMISLFFSFVSVKIHLQSREWDLKPYQYVHECTYIFIRVRTCVHTRNMVRDRDIISLIKSMYLI